MASKTSRLNNLTDPGAAKTINKLFEDITNRIDEVSRSAATKRISNSAPLVFGTIPGNSCVETVVTMQGANANLIAHANPVLFLGSVNLTWNAYVSANNLVKVKVCNTTTSPITVNTVIWNILVS